MYDDVLSATTLVGVSAVIAAVFVSAATEPPQRSPVALATAQAPAVPAARTSGQPPEAMPVYELPRVVVTGHRSRDGDVLATSAAKPKPEPAAPYLAPAR